MFFCCVVAPFNDTLQSDKVNLSWLINFQSFNSYRAESIECTTFSFAVNVSTFLLYIPEQSPPKRKDGFIRPDDSQCHFRGRLRRTVRLRKPEDRDIRFVDPNGKNLLAVMNHVRERVEIDCPSCSRLEGREEALSILQEDSEGI